MSSGFTSERCWIWGHKHSYTHTYTMTRWVECSHYFKSIAEAPIEYIQKGPRDMLNTMQIAFFILLWRMDRMWGRGGRWSDTIVWRKEAQCRVLEKHSQLHVHIQSLWEEHLTFRTIRTQTHAHPRFRCAMEGLYVQCWCISKYLPIFIYLYR